MEALIIIVLLAIVVLALVLNTRFNTKAHEAKINRMLILQNSVLQEQRLLAHKSALADASKRLRPNFIKISEEILKLHTISLDLLKSSKNKM
jgi:hypothetical protein